MRSLKRMSYAVLTSAILCVTQTANATLSTQTIDGWNGTLNLVDSRLTIQVADQWIDVEEEAELQPAPGWNASVGPWIAQGTITFPEGAAITGCMLWNGDTLLMGKLRGKAQANKIFDSLVPPVTTRWPVDPLLIEQVSKNVYNVKLYPLQTGSTRKFRIRYLVPRLAGSGTIAVAPLLRDVNGSIPQTYRLRLRGKAEGLRLATSDGIWPVALPFSDLVATSRGATLLWDSPAGAVRGRADSGRWAGEYAMYSGDVPDSVITKTAIRSETVVLWSWIQPECFFTSGDYWQYLTYYGSEAIRQASLIDEMAVRSGANGARMGLVADLGNGEAPLSWPIADSSASSYAKMRRWLQSIDENALRSLVPQAQSGASGGQTISDGKEIALLRKRFQVDVRKVATLYSADSGIIRHLVVVTAGIATSSAKAESIDPRLLPSGVSIASSRLQSDRWYYEYVGGNYVYKQAPPAVSFWPGVDLPGFANDHRAVAGNLQDWNGVALPKIRSLSTARLSIGSGLGTIRRNVVLARNAQGRLQAGLSVHAPSVDAAVKWELFDDSGRTLSSWMATPKWTDVGVDSILPRLWAKSEAPIAPQLEGQDLGPIFGVVDPFHSLLATPSDTVGVARQATLRDSGVPFLTYADIFPRQGYGTEGQVGGGGNETGISARVARDVLRISWIASSRMLHVDLTGLDVRGIEIRDLQGRLLASIPASQVAGLASLDWKAPGNLGRGLLLVTVRAADGIHSGTILVH